MSQVSTHPPAPRVPSARRNTLQQHRFLDTVQTLTSQEAVAPITDTRTAASTEATYRAAEPQFEAACARAAQPAWPPTVETLETFAGYLKGSAAFVGPAVYRRAVVEAVGDRGLYCRFNKKWADGVATGLEGVLSRSGSPIVSGHCEASSHSCALRGCPF